MRSLIAILVLVAIGVYACTASADVIVTKARVRACDPAYTLVTPVPTVCGPAVVTGVVKLDDKRVRTKTVEKQAVARRVIAVPQVIVEAPKVGVCGPADAVRSKTKTVERSGARVGSRVRAAAAAVIPGR